MLMSSCTAPDFLIKSASSPAAKPACLTLGSDNATLSLTYCDDNNPLQNFKIEHDDSVGQEVIVMPGRMALCLTSDLKMGDCRDVAFVDLERQASRAFQIKANGQCLTFPAGKQLTSTTCQAKGKGKALKKKMKALTWWIEPILRDQTAETSDNAAMIASTLSYSVSKILLDEIDAQRASMDAQMDDILAQYGVTRPKPPSYDNTTAN